MTHERFTRGRCGFCGALVRGGGATCLVCGRPLDASAPPSTPAAAATPSVPSASPEAAEFPSTVAIPPSQAAPTPDVPLAAAQPARGIRGWIARHRGEAWFDFARVVLAVTMVGVTFGGLRLTADRAPSGGQLDDEPVRSASPRARRATSTPAPTRIATPAVSATRTPG
ncbi:MAG: hypothetical protein U0360_09440 [Dehalococcoidia bacterium]